MKNATSQQEVFNNLLITPTLNNEPHNRNVNTGDVVNIVGEYLVLSYKIEATPLQHLKKCFYAFNWRFYSEEDLKEAHNPLNIIIGLSDYLWITHERSCWWTGIVTATRKSIPTDTPCHSICHRSQESIENKCDYWDFAAITSGRGKLLHYHQGMMNQAMLLVPTQDPKGNFVLQELVHEQVLPAEFPI